MRVFFYVEWCYWLLGFGWHDMILFQPGVTVYLGPLRLVIEKRMRLVIEKRRRHDTETPI